MDIPTDISSWILDARQRLSEAEIICGKANAYLLSSAERLSRRDNRLPKLLYLFDATKQQLRLLGILKDSLVMCLQQLMERSSAVNTKLKKDVARLTNLVHSLKNVKLEEGFHKSADSPRVLFDFISDEGIKELVRKIEALLQHTESLANEGRIDILLQSLNTDIDSFQHDLDSLYNLFLSSSSLPWSAKTKQQSSIDKDADSINRLLQMNSELELDMVSLLKSLSNHYDQCTKGQTLLQSAQMPQNEKRELYAVLQNDVQELPSVLEILEQDRVQILQNCDYISNICDQSEKFYRKVEAYVQSLQSFAKEKLQARYMPDFKAGVGPLETSIINAEQYHEEVLDLVDYYNNFVRSYNALVLEIDRRHRVNDRISHLVSTLQQQIAIIEEEDGKAREHFLLEHSQFLPQNIIDPLPTDSPSSILFNTLPLATVEFTKEILPKVSQDSVEKSRKTFKK